MWNRITRFRQSDSIAKEGKAAMTPFLKLTQRDNERFKATSGLSKKAANVKSEIQGKVSTNLHKPCGVCV